MTFIVVEVETFTHQKDPADSLPALQIILHSMHRYHPRFHIIQADDMFSVRWSVFQTFTFPETAFMAVTAYQNTKVSLLRVHAVIPP
jgi:hypothetical protein